MMSRGRRRKRSRKGIGAVRQMIVVRIEVMKRQGNESGKTSRRRGGSMWSKREGRAANQILAAALIMWITFERKEAKKWEPQWKERRKKGLGKGERRGKKNEKGTSRVQSPHHQRSNYSTYSILCLSTLYSLSPFLLITKMTCAHLISAQLCSRQRKEGVREWTQRLIVRYVMWL